MQKKCLKSFSSNEFRLHKKDRQEDMSAMTLMREQRVDNRHFGLSKISVSLNCLLQRNKDDE